MLRKPKSAALLSLAALIATPLVGCGGDDANDSGETPSPAADAPTEDAPDTDDDTSSDDGSGDGECAMPQSLVDQLGVDRQIVLGLALAAGENFDSVEATRLPEPDTFRFVADALDDAELSGVEPNPNFDEPAVVIDDLYEVADLVDAALAAGADTSDPAWTELSEFYTQEFFVQHSSSVGYYMTEAGCV